eukprot:761042-Hanusia_phi.AAC.1
MSRVRANPGGEGCYVCLLPSKQKRFFVPTIALLALSTIGVGATDLFVETTDERYLAMKKVEESEYSITLVDNCCDSYSTFRLKEFPEGRLGLQNVLSHGILGIVGGKFLFVEPGDTQRSSNSTVDMLWVVDELLGTHTCSFRSDTGVLLGFDEDEQPCEREVGNAGVKAMFMLRDETLYRKLDELRNSGFTVLEVLEPAEADDARDALQSIIQRSMGGSDGYQIRIPDIAVHHPLFGELLVHPAILVGMPDVLHGRATHYCRTWIIQDLVGMWVQVDYPYHDIEIGMWPDLPLGLQVVQIIPLVKLNFCGPGLTGPLVARQFHI